MENGYRIKLEETNICFSLQPSNHKMLLFVLKCHDLWKVLLSDLLFVAGVRVVRHLCKQLHQVNNLELGKCMCGGGVQFSNCTCASPEAILIMYESKELQRHGAE